MVNSNDSLFQDVVLLKDALFLRDGEEDITSSKSMGEALSALAAWPAVPQTTGYLPIADLVLRPKRPTRRHPFTERLFAQHENLTTAERAAKAGNPPTAFQFVRPCAIRTYSAKTGEKTSSTALAASLPDGDYLLQRIPSEYRRVLVMKSFNRVSIVDGDGYPVEVPCVEAVVKGLSLPSVTLDCALEDGVAHVIDILYLSGAKHFLPTRERLDLVRAHLHDGDCLKLPEAVLATKASLPAALDSLAPCLVRGVDDPYPLSDESGSLIGFAPVDTCHAVILRRTELAMKGRYEYRWGLLPGDLNCGDLYRAGGELFAESGQPFLSAEKIARGTGVTVEHHGLHVYEHASKHYFSARSPRIVGKANSVDELPSLSSVKSVPAEPAIPVTPGVPLQYAIKEHWTDEDCWLTFEVDHVDYVQSWKMHHAESGIIGFPVRSSEQVVAKSADCFKVDVSTGVFKEYGGKRATLFSAPMKPTLKAVDGPLTRTVDAGTVEYGAQKSYFREFFLSGGKWAGRLAFRMLATKRSYAGESTGGQETPAYWLCMRPESQTPYVLSPEAARKGWLPPLGISALPGYVQEGVDPHHCYWELDGRGDALEARDGLISGEKAIRQVFGTSGGKKYLCPTILERMPEHQVYVEPFCGGAAVFFSKQPSAKEVLGDVNDEGINCYNVLKMLTPETKARLERMDFLYTPQNFQWATTYKGDDPLEKFRRWIFMTHMTYGGRTDRLGAKPSMRIQGKGWAGIRRLDSYHERLKNVELRNADYKDVVTEFDGPNTFHYLDPPYTRHAEADIGFVPMAEIARLLRGVKGKWLLSCMDNEQNRGFFSGYHMEVVHRGTMGMADRQTGDQRRQNVELLIANYPLKGGKSVSGLPQVAMEFVVKQDDQHIVGGPVYPARKVDSQGEWASDQANQEAMYEFMEYHQGFNVDHATDIAARVLECFQAEEDTRKGGKLVTKGTWWLTVRVLDDGTWARVKSGELRGFSWEGLKMTKEASVPR